MLHPQYSKILNVLLTFMVLDIPQHLSNKIINKGKVTCEFRFPEEAKPPDWPSKFLFSGYGWGAFLEGKADGVWSWPLTSI